MKYFLGFWLGRHRISSSDFCVSGHFLFPNYTSFRFLSLFQRDCAEIRDSYKFLKLELNRITCLDDCVSLYEEMRRMRPLPSVILFNQLLSRVVKLENYSNAICLFRNFCCLGIPIDEYTMNIAINSYCLSDRVDLGFSILGSFFKRGCVPNAFTFTTLLKGLFRENRSSDALELFRKIVREKLCELDVVVYGTVIDGICKTGNVPPAMELLRIMEKGSCKPNTHIYSMVIDALCKGKMVDSALQLFAEMSEKNVLANVVTYTTLICCLCHLGRWGDAKILLKKMIDRKVSPNVLTFNSIIDALCREGLIEEVVSAVNIMQQQNVVPDSVTYNTLMNGYCQRGQLDEARKVFDSMVGRGVAPGIENFTTLINGYCMNMKIEDAMNLFREMQRKGLKPDVVTYNTMLHGLFHGGRYSDALELFDELRAVGIKPDPYMYCTLLDGLCHNGELEQAISLLEELERKRDHLHISYYNVVMNGLVEDNKLDRVRAIFDDLGSKGLRPDVITYNILIKGCCQDGLLDEAKDFILSMKQENVLPNEITYNCIVQACLKWGKYDDANMFLEELMDKGFSQHPNTLELVLSLPGTVENNPTLFKMAQKLAPNSFGEKVMTETVSVDPTKLYFDGYTIDLNHPPPVVNHEGEISAYFSESLDEEENSLPINQESPEEEDDNSSPINQESSEEEEENSSPINQENVPEDRKRRVLTNAERWAVYHALLERIVDGKLKRNTTKEVQAMFNVKTVRTIQRIWKIHKRTLAGIDVDVSSRKTQNCGCKQIQIDLSRVQEVQLHQRTTLTALRML